MEYRRPILQEMDTQEYDWVRLYIEKSPAKLYYCLAGDSGQERFIYVLTKQTRSKLDFDWISRSFNSILSDFFLFIPYQTPFSFIRKPKKSLFFRNTKSLHFYLS